MKQGAYLTPRALDFVNRYGRRVLTDDGKPGRDGREGIGSSTERAQDSVAAAIFANCEPLDNAQLDELIGWFNMYRITVDVPMLPASSVLACNAMPSCPGGWNAY